MHMIEIKNLTKSYGKQRGIENISMAIEEGDIYGFIGPNGAGKSTTIRTMLGLLKPNSGQIKIFNKDINNHLEEILKEIGYLPSEVAYYEGMKVKDLLNYSASFYPNVNKERITYLANHLELDLNKKIDDLSLGNKKKVGIIQGLLHEPKLIILDEPTSGLDPLMQQRFFDLLIEENKKGVTILFSSHILSEVQRLCNKLAFIKDGKIIKETTMEKLNKEQYKKVHLISKDSLIIDSLDIKDLKHENNEYYFLYNGAMSPLIMQLNQMEIEDLSISEPTLEEIFMHYYES